MKNIFDSKTNKDISIEIDSMNRDELVEMIQRQHFKIKELKKDKKSITMKNQKER